MSIASFLNMFSPLFLTGLAIARFWFFVPIAIIYPISFWVFLLIRVFWSVGSVLGCLVYEDWKPEYKKMLEYEYKSDNYEEGKWVARFFAVFLGSMNLCNNEIKIGIMFILFLILNEIYYMLVEKIQKK